MAAAWDTLLAEIRKLHDGRVDLQEFCPLLDDLPLQVVVPHHTPAADLMAANPGETTSEFADIRDALVGAAPLARWRETYKDTRIGTAFREKFACYEVIGRDAPFACAGMRSFVVWTPPGLYYPWHHHPAEEIYLVLAGKAEFALHGAETRILHPGDSVFHASNQPHAMTTHDQPVMAYVMWRGDLETVPVLTGPEELQ